MREPRHAPLVRAGSPGAAPTSASSILGIVVSVVRGLIDGALPLVILVCLVALFWETLTIVRYVTVSNGFALTRQIEAGIALGGLAISLIVFLVAGMRTLRSVRDRHYEGDYIESTVAMAVLAISLLVVLISVFMTMGMPQNPAP